MDDGRHVPELDADSLPSFPTAVGESLTEEDAIERIRKAEEEKKKKEEEKAVKAER